MGLGWVDDHQGDGGSVGGSREVVWGVGIGEGVWDVGIGEGVWGVGVGKGVALVEHGDQGGS